MSYTVNWLTKVITVPTSDLTLVSGTRYSLDLTLFLAEIRRLEWEASEGLWADNILNHENTKVDFAGINYPPFDEMVNGYTWFISGIAERVDLTGSNNNLIDTLINTGVSVVPSNSAGNTVTFVNSGSGLSESEKVQLTIAANANNSIADDGAGNAVIYKDDGVTPSLTYTYEVDAEGNPTGSRTLVTVDAS